MHALCSRVQKMSSPLGLELRATVWVLGMKPSALNCGANSPAQYFLRQTMLETREDTFCKTEKLPREPEAEQLIGHLEVHVAVCIDCSRASLHLGKDSIHKEFSAKTGGIWRQRTSRFLLLLFYVNTKTPKKSVFQSSSLLSASL